MSFFTAQDIFSDNLVRFNTLSDRELMWNLSSGLKDLSQALEADLGQIRGILNQIQQALQRQGRP
jgi:hypothetical protein